MTKEQIEQMLDEMGLDYRYHHFSTKDAVDPPFLIWLIPETVNFYADGIVYAKIQKLQIELYTDEKNWELEEKLEGILDKHGISWQQVASEWIESESMWESLYEIEVYGEIEGVERASEG